MADLPPWMIAENFGEHTGQPRGGPQPLPPGFPDGLWIDVTSSPAPAGGTGSPSSTAPPASTATPTVPTANPEYPGGEQQPGVPPVQDFFDNLPPYTNPPPNAQPRDPRQEQPPEARWEDEGPPGTPREWDRLGWPPGLQQIMWQPTEPARPRVEMPFPDDPTQPPVANGDTERARRRQGARERDAIIREAAERARIDTRVRRGRGVIEGVLRRVVPRIVGRVLGPVGEILTPEPLGSGEVPEDELARRTAEGIERQLDELERRTRELYDPYRGRQLPGGTENAPLPPLPPPVISAPWPPSPMNLPSPSRPPRSTPAPPTPAPATTAPPTMTTQTPPWLVPTLLGLAAVLVPRAGWRSWTEPLTSIAPSPVPSVDPLTPPAPAPGTDPLTPPSGNPLTRFEPAQLGFGPPATRTRTRTRECECKPKKRKKARECTTRGNLVWSSGPKKGKPAGSRCINFKGKK